MNAQQITFTSETGLSVVVWRDETPPMLAGGYGGWQVVSRMRRVGIPNYVGVDPIRIQIPVLFDGWMDQASQEINISTLERMARPAIQGGEPPAIQVFGGIPRPDIKWWLIEDLDYSGQQKVEWGVKGGVPVRLRQDLVVKLIQQIKSDRVALATLGTGFGPGGAPSPAPRHKFHVVKAGETMAQISTEEYGNPGRVRDILTANGIRDPKSIKEDQKLRLP